jgi:Protein of unknown function (DUF1353)
MAIGDGTSALEVVLTEARQHQETIGTSHRLLNWLGTLLPLVGTILLIPLTLDLALLSKNYWAALFLTSVSMLGLLLHFTWTEFINLVRYKYGVLYPRLFSLANHFNWTNFLEFSSPRSLMSWVPALLYNVVAAMLLVAVWIKFLLLPALTAGAVAEGWCLCALGAATILALWAGSQVTLISARMLERDIKFCLGRIYHPPLPFISQLQLVPVGDQIRFMLADDLWVEIRSGDAPHQLKKVVIPKGFLTDLASVPRMFWPIFPPWEQYGPAALLHDYLYSQRSWSRKQSDESFKLVMGQLGVSSFTRNMIYIAVRFGGARAKQVAEQRLRPDAATQERILERFRRADQQPVFDRVLD